ncbi:hypothetical protein MMC17_000242 [Xylographa soralifera]|nr:hypothetical protein [Xylographa soralifera]
MTSLPSNGVTPVSNTKVSIPISPTDATVAVFERTLRSSVQTTLNKLHLGWNSISLWRRGTNPSKPADCPVTIVITTAKSDTPIQNQWQSAVSEIQQNIHAATNLPILVELVQEDLRLFVVQDLPYLRPPPVGYSLGPLEESIAVGNNTGTLGGYVSLTNQGHSQYILTCNHVANPRDFMEKDLTPDHVQKYSMLCPSNNDNSETIATKIDKGITTGNSNEIKHFHDTLNKLNLDLPLNVRRELAKEQLKLPKLPSIADNWLTFQQQLDVGEYYAAGSILSALMQRRVNNFAACPRHDQLQAATQEFQTACTELLSSHDLAAANKSFTVERTVGATRFASGKRVGAHLHKEETPTYSILDWALVDVGHDFGVNGIPHMRELAKKVAPGKGLAGGAALRIGTLLDLKEANIVFKQGRTTGLTVGRVSLIKELLNVDALLYMQAVLPTTKLPDGKDVVSTHEWTAVALEPAAGWSGGVQIAKDGVFAKPGDSGAWIITEDALVVGIVWSGFPTRAYVTDMAMVGESVHTLTGGNLALSG